MNGDNNNWVIHYRIFSNVIYFHDSLLIYEVGLKYSGVVVRLISYFSLFLKPLDAS